MNGFNWAPDRWNLVIAKAVEYFNSQLDLPTIPESLAVEATKALTKNNIDIETDHEVRIFNKYV